MSELSYMQSLDELLKTIVKNENVVVVFSARDWCVPCQRLHPHVQAAASQLDDYLFLDVDVDHVEGVKEHFGIMSVPQVWFYEHEEVPGREVKARTALQIIAEIRRD